MLQWLRESSWHLRMVSCVITQTVAQASELSAATSAVVNLGCMSGTSKDLEKELMRRAVADQTSPPRYVLFVDMLGFSALTEAHPNDIDWDFDSPDGVHSRTSESASQIGRFQWLLDLIVRD